MTKTPPPTERFRFPKAMHLRKPAEFKRVYDARRSASDERLVVYALENELPHARLGLSVSRKVGNAVRRNRWKRLLREAFRLNVRELPAGFDLVLVARPTIEPKLTELVESLVRLAGQAARRRGRRGP